MGSSMPHISFGCAVRWPLAAGSIARLQITVRVYSITALSQAFDVRSVLAAEHIPLE